MTANVLVTGGAGFIGSHLTRALIQKGYAVRVLDNLAYGRRECIPTDALFIQGDISNLDCCHAAMQDVQYVFHCAAMSRAAPSLAQMDICTQVNIVGTQNILMAAREAKVKKIIYSGSSTYYGNQPTPHIEYETPAEFLNFYSLSKHVGESYCLMFDKLFNLPSVILRYFNVYGPGQPRQGVYALVIGCFLDQWRRNEPLIIHGTGEQRRDFIHVQDVVQANIAALKEDVRHQIFNIGSGTNLSIKTLAHMISPHHVHQPRRPGDAEETLANIERARKYLRWQPKISFAKGLSELMKADYTHRT